jgi:hypothetical protein
LTPDKQQWIFTKEIFYLNKLEQEKLDGLNIIKIEKKLTSVEKGQKLAK